MKKEEELDEEVRQIYVHLQQLGLANFFKSDQFDLFCEENKIEKVRDDIVKSLLGTYDNPLPIKNSPDSDKVIIDYRKFPEIIVKPFLKKFLIEILDKKESKFVEIIVSLLAYYSRYNVNFVNHKPTRIDNDLMCRIGFDLLDLDFNERDIRMYYSLEGYDLDALLSMNDPKPIPKGGRKKYQKNNQEVGVISDKPNRKIFIVHGQNEIIKNDVEAFLSSIGLEPIILHKQADLGKTIIEKVEHYSDVGFAVILLTKEDVGTKYVQYVPVAKNPSKKAWSVANQRTNRELLRNFRFRARQNVIFEFGFFIAKLGRNKVAALCEERIERPSDIDGLLYTPIDNNGEWKKKIAREINMAGISIEEKFL